MKIQSEFIVDDNNYEDGGMCKILSFDFPKISGLSHGQFVSVVNIDEQNDFGNQTTPNHIVLDSLKGKKVRITLEVIG